MDNQIIYTVISLDDLSSLVADKVAEKLSKTSLLDPQSQSSQEDILFKSVAQAAAYYGICYQTLSRHLHKIPHLSFGRAIRIYKSDIDNANRKYKLFSKKGTRS